MQISEKTTGLPSLATDTQTGKDIHGRAVQGSARPGRETAVPATAASAGPAQDDPGAMTVSISASTEVDVSNTAPTPVYAEIWKGAIKLAQVDIHGHVTSFSGMPTPEGATGGGVLAAQRAVQLAQQTGGEVRVAGTPLNSQTLLTRARLEQAYAI